MAANNSLNQETKSRAAVQVAEWKREVQSFFDNDWSRLRTLIRNLEEQLWNDNSPAALQSIDHHSELKSRTHHGTREFSAQLQHDRTETESEPIIKDRLTELAEQIERRLQTAHVDGT